MKRLIFLAFSLMLAASPAFADGLESDLVAQLRRQGFYQVEVSRTLLGRIRLVAQSDTRWREVIVNPSTGEILRDYSELLVASGDDEPVLLDPALQGGSSGGKSGSGSDDGSSGSGSGDDSSGGGSGDDSSGGGNSGSGSSGGGGSDNGD